MSRIETINVRPPVELRQYDWQAHYPDDEGDGFVGYGPTEADALKDLCEQIAESREFWRAQFELAVGSKA